MSEPSEKISCEKPNDWESLNSSIQAQYSSLSKQLQKVAKLVMDDPQMAAYETLAILAAKADTQPSAFIRFAQSMGYDGFNELKTILRATGPSIGDQYRHRIEELGGGASWQGDAVLGRLIETSQAALQGLDTTDEAQISKIVERLYSADTVYIVGSKRAYPVASYLFYGMTHAGCRAQLVSGEGGMGQESLAHAGSNDLVFAVSYTPYSEQTRALVNWVRKNQVPVVSLTDSMVSPLVELSEEVLYVRDGEFEGFRSLAASMVLAQAVVLMLANYRND